MNKLLEHISDQKKVFRAAKDEYTWLKRTNFRFWLLEHVFKNRTIEVSNWESFEPDHENQYDGCPNGIDVDISLPPIPRDIYYCAKGYIKWKREFGSFPKIKNHIPWFSDRWVFEINNIESFYKLPAFDAWFILCECKPQYKNSTIPQFHKVEDHWDEWVRKHLPAILLSGPLVTFDNIWTSEKNLKKEHVAEYTKQWLKKWYPGLCKRKIAYVEKRIW